MNLSKTKRDLDLDFDLEIEDPERLFLHSIKSPITKRAYLFNIQGFMRFVNSKTINNLITDFKDHKDIQRRIISYIMKLKEEGMNYYAIKNYISPVITFYKINDILLNSKKISMFMPPKIRVKKTRGYNQEELQKLVDVADERMKVVIYLLRSSGPRIGAIRDLRVRNLQKMKDEKTNEDLYEVTYYENTSEEYPSFVTPEGTRAIDSYLDMRRRYGEKITEDSILIREQFDVRDPFSISNPKQIATSTLQGKLRDIGERAGIRERIVLKEGQNRGSIRKEVAVSHGFRKSFTTFANNAGMKIIHRRMLEGHDVGIDDHYVLPTQDDLLKEYQKAIDPLTINPENRLKRKVEKLEVERSQVR